MNKHDFSLNELVRLIDWGDRTEYTFSRVVNTDNSADKTHIRKIPAGTMVRVTQVSPTYVIITSLDYKWERSAGPQIIRKLSPIEYLGLAAD